MKKILLKYYSRKNFGDDMFVILFADYFNDCRINLIANPLYIPKSVKKMKNVKIHPYSYVNVLLNKLIFLVSKIKISLRFIDFLNRCFTNFLNHSYYYISKNHDASVEIGGSIFMDKKNDKEIIFRTKEKPDFSLNSNLQDYGNFFIIGANLGPVYSQDYWNNIKEKFKTYNHICLRDWSSYTMVSDLPNVQYAPDVLFLITKSTVCCKRESVVISVIDISVHTSKIEIVNAYNELLIDTIIYFNNKNIPVTLVSFCKREGDENAITDLLNKIENTTMISTCFYKDNIDEILDLFANATYVIGSRFHSIIIGILFEKPVFPIVYNCKTENYLADLQFNGKSARLNELSNLTVEDLIYNYDNNIIANCSEHKKYAKNQFWGLSKYLNDYKN